MAKGLEAAILVLARKRPLDGDRIGRLTRQAVKSIVASEAKT
jgi:hypothetical protein